MKPPMKNPNVCECVCVCVHHETWRWVRVTQANGQKNRLERIVGIDIMLRKTISLSWWNTMIICQLEEVWTSCSFLPTSFHFNIIIPASIHRSKLGESMMVECRKGKSICAFSLPRPALSSTSAWIVAAPLEKPSTLWTGGSRIRHVGFKAAYGNELFPQYKAQVATRYK